MGLKKRNFGNGTVTFSLKKRTSLKGLTSGGGPHYFFWIISKSSEKLKTEVFHLYFIYYTTTREISAI